MTVLRIVVANVALALSVVTTGQAQQPPPPTVNVVTAEKRPVTEAVRFVGRIEAIERVDIRARVNGYLEGVLFKDGDNVKTGAALYHIEKGPFEAAVQQAKATMLRARAQLDNATIQRQRAEDLLRSNSGTVATRDDRIAAEKIAAGDLAAAEAGLKTAEINLAYTDITSPIDGQIGRTAVTRGNVVGPDFGDPHDDRQLKPHVCHVSGQSARIHSYISSGSRRPSARQQFEGDRPAVKRTGLPARGKDRFRRCESGSRHRHGCGACVDSKSGRPACRRTARSSQCGR